jgi:hypothetical protein
VTFGLKNGLIAASASSLISAGSYFATVQGVHHWLPRIGAIGTAVVSGFPIPYAAYFPANESSHLFYPVNLVGDFAIWFAIAFLVTSAFSLRRLLLASLAGLALTALTLLLPSLAMATPEDIPVVCSGAPMGFPFEYLFRLNCSPLSGVSYEFNALSAALDFGLWLGVAFSAIGLYFFLLASMTRYGTLKVSAVIGVLVLLAIGANAALAANAEYLSASCNSLGIDSGKLPIAGPGLRYVCGEKSVTDGNLSITLNNYHFVEGPSIEWEHGSGGSGVYLLVNATIQNVGGEGAHMGPFFWVWLTNETGGPVVSLNEYGLGAAFPGQYPNASVPAPGSTYLAPGGSDTYWFVFNMDPKIGLQSTQSLSLRYLVWQEFSYGEILTDSGQWECGQCSNAQARLVVLG